MTRTAVGQGFADVLADVGVGHAGRLGQHERGNAVLIHFLLAVVGDQSVSLLLAQHPTNALLDDRSIASLAGNVAGGQKGHDGESGDSGARTIVPIAPAALGFVLHDLQRLQSAFDGAIHALGVFRG